MYTIVQTFSNRGLNTSPKLRTYTPVLSSPSSTGVFRYLFSGRASGLDAFSLYPLQRGYPAVPFRTTGKLVAAKPCSSRTGGSFPSGIITLLLKRNQPGSRRSKPSSRPLLMGEQPHPCQLLHQQDRGSRRRSSKPPGRYGLLQETTQLSLG